MTGIKVSAFRWVPPVAQGLVRDLRVRWALEELGLDYDMQLLDFGEQSGEAYRALQPFGQVPVLEENGLVLFESGAILMHLCSRNNHLLPADPADRARAVSWIFAALNSVEPPIMMLIMLDMGPEGAASPEYTQVAQFVRKRLKDLAAFLETRDYLVADFSAADLLMASVLRQLRKTTLVEEQPVLIEYLQRCLARPAFEKALNDQLATFAEHAPA